MAVTFTASQAMLSVQATALAAEATTAGLTSLATALSNLSTEITQTLTEQEFFGGGTTTYTGGSGASGTDYDSAALVWTQTLNSAANIIQSRNSNFIKASLSAIETDVDTMSANSTTIKDKQTTIADKQTVIADKQTVIADKQTAMETYQKKLKELGEGAGIHIIGAYDVFGMISTYRLMIEQAKVLDNTDKATASQITAALAEVDRVSQLIKDNIPREF
jgi:hypothetical protein